MKLDEVERKRRATLVADQYGGISPIHEAFYIQPIIYAAERSESAFQKFDTAVAASESPNLIFAAVQEGLTHAGALSRFFWPMKKENPLSVARGQKLRSAFFLQEESALKWRRLRNAFEHFDEDLDQFLLQDPVGYIFPSPIIDDEDLADETLANILSWSIRFKAFVSFLARNSSFARLEPKCSAFCRSPSKWMATEAAFEWQLLR